MLTIVPISLATMVEHIGDISAISSTVGKNFIEDPGLHRTLTGDGLATTVAALLGTGKYNVWGKHRCSYAYKRFMIRKLSGWRLCLQ